MLSTSKVKS